MRIRIIAKIWPIRVTWILCVIIIFVIMHSKQLIGLNFQGPALTKIAAVGHWRNIREKSSKMVNQSSSHGKTNNRRFQEGLSQVENRFPAYSSENTPFPPSPIWLFTLPSHQGSLTTFPATRSKVVVVVVFLYLLSTSPRPRPGWVQSGQTSSRASHSSLAFSPLTWLGTTHETPTSYLVVVQPFTTIFMSKRWRCSCSKPRSRIAMVAVIMLWKPVRNNICWKFNSFIIQLINLRRVVINKTWIWLTWSVARAFHSVASPRSVNDNGCPTPPFPEGS